MSNKKNKTTATKQGRDGLNVVDLLVELDALNVGTTKADSTRLLAAKHPAIDEALRLFNNAEGRKGETTARLNVMEGVFSLYTGENQVFWSDANPRYLAMVLVGQDTSHLAEDPKADPVRSGATTVIAGSEKGGPIEAPAASDIPSEEAKDGPALAGLISFVPPAFGAPSEEEIADRFAVNAKDGPALAGKIINPLPTNLKTRLLEITIGRRPSGQYFSQHVDFKLTLSEAEALTDIAAGLRNAGQVTPQKGKLIQNPMDVLRYLVGYACIAVEAARSEVSSDG